MFDILQKIINKNKNNLLEIYLKVKESEDYVKDERNLQDYLFWNIYKLCKINNQSKENSILVDLDKWIQDILLFIKCDTIDDSVMALKQKIFELLSYLGDLGRYGLLFLYELELESIVNEFIVLEKNRKYVETSKFKITKNNLYTLQDLASSINIKNIDYELVKSIIKTINRLEYVPIRDIVIKYFIIIKDVSNDLGKKVNFILDDNDVVIAPIYKPFLDDSLVQLIKNSLDHGIELPEDRLLVGKNKVGTISITVNYEENDFVSIEFRDDGRGIDLERLKIKSIKNQLISSSDIISMSDDELLRLIFHPELSTKDEADLVSGRGMGMDIVKNNIQKINGTIDIKSELNKGTTFYIKIPNGTDCNTNYIK